MIRKFLSCIGLLMVGVLLIAGLIAWQSYHFWFQSPSKSAETVSYTVEEGAGFSSIANDLKERELIANKTWFRIFSIIDGSARDIQAGDFELRAGMSYSSIMDVLVDADSEEISITFPEGLTVVQMGELVVEKFGVTQAEWDAVVGLNSPFNDHELVVESQKPAGTDLEGYLFPDTYRFFVEATAEDIVGTMLDNMQDQVSKNDLITAGRQPEIKSFHEVLTIASILEREVRTKDDIPLVSDIIYKRLEIGMALQMDSTVNYFTGKDTPSISLADRDIEHPYNTYLNPGLPPGPISNPGLDSIKGAISPVSNDYFYFLTDEEGKVYYGVTFDQHVANKNEHLR